MESHAELVIIGGGLAGFSAALTAAQVGADVLVLEGQNDIGGSSVMSGGCLAFAGTDLQRAQGIEDSDELLFNDLREVGQFENDERIVTAYLRDQLATYEWLRGLGVQFSPLVETSSGQSVPRVHTVDPADLVRLLAARAKASGKVRVLTSARATRLLRDGSTGQVNGVLVDLHSRAQRIRADRAVMLATGGFCRNPELIHRFAPHYDEAVFVGGDGSLGEGLTMAWALGADFRDLPYIKGTFGKHPTDTTNHHSCLAVYKGAIAINQEGHRFVDESISYKLLGDACMQQPYHSAYQIFDRDIFASGDNRVRILDFERRLQHGLLIEAQSIDELAGLIEVPTQTLVATLERYNRFVDQGHDADFDRKHLVHRHGRLRRIERAPFYAYPSTAAVFGTYCGLCVDDSMAVIDVFGVRIPSLFAAGEVVGGLHGAAYMTGSALGKAAIFGRIAARSALNSTISSAPERRVAFE